MYPQYAEEIVNAVNENFSEKSLPNVCRTIINPGVKFLDLFILKNIFVMTLLTE